MRLLVLFCFAGCTSLFYHPDRYQYVEPKNLKLEYREITFHPKDGTELIGWFFPAKGEVKGTIIHFHGNAQNMSSHFLGLSWVMEKGYNLFTFDYRGYGISDGEPTPQGVHQDALAALDQARKLWGEHGKGRFIVYGQSLGGAIAMRALGDYSDVASVDLLVQDATFMSYQSMAFDKLAHSLLLPLSPLAYVLVSDEYASTEIVRNFKRPTLVIVSKKDKVVAAKFGKEIYKALPEGRKWLWVLPKGEHITTFYDPKDPLRERFLQLVESLDSVK